MITHLRLAQLFVSVADTSSAGDDETSCLHRLTDALTEFLNIDAVGLTLADNLGGVKVDAGVTDKRLTSVLFELQDEQGPCVDCLASGRPVTNVDVTRPHTRWPSFAAKARAAGFATIHALPLRCDGALIGAINLFCTDHQPLGVTELAIGQALADVATTNLLHKRGLAEAEQLVRALLATERTAAQLQTALNSRVLLEQAKGMLAERAAVNPDEAFELMRTEARRSGRTLRDVAIGVLGHNVATANAALGG